MNGHSSDGNEAFKTVIATYLNFNPFYNVFSNTSSAASFYRNYLHQVHLLSRLAFQRPIRVLVADEIGLGKTVEAIRIIKHLMKVDGIKRILIITPPILVDQWIQKDLKNFGIKPILIDKNNINELYEKARNGLIDSGVFIGSMDRLKLSSSGDVGASKYPYFEFISSINWDLVIIDEAHKLSYIGNAPSIRYERLGALCRNRAKHCVLLTATPHRGRTEDFVARLILLDESLIPRPLEVARKIETLGLRSALFQYITDVIFFRRIKEDVNKLEEEEVFKPAHQFPVLIHVPEHIRKLHMKILDFVTRGLDRYYIDPRLRGVRELLRKLIIKRAMSSEAAMLSTFMRIGARRGGVDEEELGRLSSRLQSLISEDEEVETELDDDIQTFIEAVSSFVDPLKADKLRSEIEQIIQEVRNIISENRSPKIQALADIVDLTLGAKEGFETFDAFRDLFGGKIIVFTEFKDTAAQIFQGLLGILEKKIGKVSISYLRRAERIKGDLLRGVSSYEDASKYLKILPLPHGSFIAIGLLTSDTKKYLEVFQRMLEDRRLATAVLVSTDVAAEGLNMQAANIVVNYEVLWSPLKRDQRIGRVWRLGQKRNVYVFDFHMGTDFERSILENFSIKIITVAEETGYTTLQYRGIIFYIPTRSMGEEEDYALRAVEMEKFNESTILGNVASALQRSFTPDGRFDIELFSEELARLALDIIRFTRQIKRELEILSKYRLDPNRVKTEVRLLLGIENENESLEVLRYMLKLVSKLGLAKVEEHASGNVIYVNGKRINGNSVRDLAEALMEITGSYSTIEQLNRTVNGEYEPILVFTPHLNEDEIGFLTFLVIYIPSEDNSKENLLYVEPLLIIERQGGIRVLRGKELVKTLTDLADRSQFSTADNVTLQVLLAKYRSGARQLSQLLLEIKKIIHSKPSRYINSKDLEELRFTKPTLIPNGNLPNVRINNKPFIIFIPSLMPDSRASISSEEENTGRIVTPEKKELVKEVSERLVKEHYERLGYKVVKISEYTPYDFEVYDQEGNLVAYVEVKGHETDELIAELTWSEDSFAKKHQDKYIVCVVPNALTNPRIICKNYSELKKIRVIKYEASKVIYSLGGRNDSPH
jgi:superfamily II DNA or RNA helicase